MVILTPAELVIKINHHTLQDKLVPLTIPKEQEGVLQARTRLVQMMLAKRRETSSQSQAKYHLGAGGGAKTLCPPTFSLSSFPEHRRQTAKETFKMSQTAASPSPQERQIWVLGGSLGSETLEEIVYFVDSSKKVPNCEKCHSQ